jgi:hypothetical protein
MKTLAPFFLLGFVGAIPLAEAQTTIPFCGFPTEATASPTPPASMTMPNGTVVGPPLMSIPVSGLDDGSGMAGIALQGRHRHCGKHTVYLYTGDNPSNVVDFTVILNPGIVSPGVAQVGCTATLGKINDVYYFGYNGEVTFPDWTVIQSAGDYSVVDPDGVTRKHVDFHISAPQVLQSQSAYMVSLNCPYNTSQ